MADNNNHVPTRIVQLIIDNMKLLFEQVKRSQDRTDKEINDLTGAITTLVTNLNTPPRVEDVNKKVCVIEEKLDKSISKTKEMILVVKIVFAIIMLAAFVAGFGSYVLYEKNSETLTKEVIKRIKIERKIDRRDVEGIIEDYMDRLKEKDNDKTFN